MVSKVYKQNNKFAYGAGTFSRWFIPLLLTVLIVGGQCHALTVNSLYDTPLYSDSVPNVSHTIGLQKMLMLLDNTDSFDKFDMTKWIAHGNLLNNKSLLPVYMNVYSSVYTDILPKSVLSSPPINPILMPLFPESSLVYEIENLSQAMSSYHYMDKPRSQNSPVPIPEPSTLVLIGMGISTLLLGKRRLVVPH